MGRGAGASSTAALAVTAGDIASVVVSMVLTAMLGCSERPPPAEMTSSPPAKAPVQPTPAPVPPIADPDHAFIVLPWAQRTEVPSLAWVRVAAPLAVAETVERRLQWTPRYGALVVEGTASTDPAVVAQQARARGASYVFTGLYSRPNWTFEAEITLWRVDAIAATPIARAAGRGPLIEIHQIVNQVLVSALKQANISIPRPLESQLLQPLTRDNYALMLVGRALAGLVADPTPQARAAIFADFDKASRIDPGNPVIARLLGEYWLRDAAPDAPAKAARSMALAADLDPSYAPAVLGAAASAAARGLWGDAGKLYVAAIALRPWDLTARLGWAGALLQTERYQEALAVLLDVKRVRADLLEVRRMLVVAYDALGDLKSLVDELLAVVVLAPGDRSAPLELASAYVALADLPHAIDMLAPMASGDAPAMYKVWMGDLLRHAGRSTEAMSWYAQATIAESWTVARGGARPGTGTMLHPRALYGQALLAARDPSVSAEALASALAPLAAIPELAPQIPWLDAEAAYARRDYQAAAEAYRRAIALDPDDLDARYNLAWSLVMAKDGAGAQQAAQQAVDAMPGDPALYYLLAASYDVAGQTALARAALGDVLAIAPEFAVAKRAATALDNGAPMLPQGTLRLHEAFLDVVTAKRDIERVLTLRKERDELRTSWFAASRDILTALGRLPLSEVRQVRKCPAVNVAQLLAEQRELERRYLQRGVEQEALEIKVRNAELFGDVQFLSRYARLRVQDIIADLPQGELDLREMWFTRDTLLAGELAAAGCTPAVVAAAYDPSRRQALPLPAIAVPPRVAAPAGAVTFFVDNRGCPDPIEVAVDGVAIGRVDGGLQRGLSATPGNRTVCLADPGTICGVVGTVREVYLHDGLTFAMRCPPVGQ